MSKDSQSIELINNEALFKAELEQKRLDVLNGKVKTISAEEFIKYLDRKFGI